MLSNLTLLILLLFAHLVGDVLVRPSIVSKYKKKSILVQVFHCFTYAGVVITLYSFYVPALEFVGEKFLFLFLSHLVIDLLSAICNPGEWFKDGEININKWYVLDQILHGSVIAFLVYIPVRYWEI